MHAFQKGVRQFGTLSADLIDATDKAPGRRTNQAGVATMGCVCAQARSAGAQHACEAALTVQKGVAWVARPAESVEPMAAARGPNRDKSHFKLAMAYNR